MRGKNMRVKEYTTIWRNKWLTANATSIPEMVAMLRAAANDLEQMHMDGIYLQNEDSLGDDYAFLATQDPELAKKYDLQLDEWDEDEEEFIEEEDSSE